MCVLRQETWNWGVKALQISEDKARHAREANTMEDIYKGMRSGARYKERGRGKLTYLGM